jgi:transposase
MTRDLIASGAWALLGPFLPLERGRAGRPSTECRRVLEGIARIAHAGAPWRDLPERFGKWNTGLAMDPRWRDAGGFQGLLEALAASGAGDARIQMIDSAVIQAHRHESRSQKRASHSNALGRSRGGFSTKIHVLTEAHGRPIAAHLTPGQAANTSAAPTLLADAEQRPQDVLADKGHDSAEMRAERYLQASHPIIAWTSNRKQPLTLDRVRYAKRNRIERMKGPLKQFRRVATRYDKTAASVLSFIQNAAIYSTMRFVRTA